MRLTPLQQCHDHTSQNFAEGEISQQGDEEEALGERSVSTLQGFGYAE